MRRHPALRGTGRRGLNGLRRGDIRRYKRNGGMPIPTSATTRRHEYHNSGAGGRGTREREAGNQKWGSGGGSHSTSRGGEDRDPIEQCQKKKKRERIDNIGERSHLRKSSRTRDALSK